MNLTRTVYESLQKEHSYPFNVTLEDVTREDCVYKNYLRFIGEEPRRPEAGSTLLLRGIESKIRSLVKTYLSSCFGDKFKPLENGFLYESIDVKLVGSIGSALVEVLPLPAGGFDATVSSGKLPGWAIALIATKAHLMKKRKALVIVFNRNNQNWCSFAMEGDFESLAKEVLSDAKELKGLLKGNGQHVGREDSCARCPYQHRCGATKTPNPKPYTVSFVRSFQSADLCTKLDRFLWDKNSEKNNRATHCIHPSEFSTFECDRRIAYGLMGINKKESIGSQLRRIFDVGHACHDVIQGVLKNAVGDRCELEVPVVCPELKIRGSCDGVIDSKDGIEIKSISYKGFDKLGGAKREHQKQGTLYGAPLSLQSMTYLYVNKDTGQLAEYPTPISKNLWHTLAARAESIIKEVERGSLPTRITKDYLCKSCPYMWKCRPELRRGQ